MKKKLTNDCKFYSGSRKAGEAHVFGSRLVTFTHSANSTLLGVTFLLSSAAAKRDDFSGASSSGGGACDDRGSKGNWFAPTSPKASYSVLDAKSERAASTAALLILASLVAVGGCA